MCQSVHLFRTQLTLSISTTHSLLYSLDTQIAGRLVQITPGKIAAGTHGTTQTRTIPILPQRMRSTTPIMEQPTIFSHLDSNNREFCQKTVSVSILPKTIRISTATARSS